MRLPNTKRALGERDAGILIAFRSKFDGLLLPGRHALLAAGARTLPFGSLLRLLHAVTTPGEVEFKVHYDHLHPAVIERARRAAGFRRGFASA